MQECGQDGTRAGSIPAIFSYVARHLAKLMRQLKPYASTRLAPAIDVATTKRRDR